MNGDQGRVWKRITEVYQQWDRDRSGLMAVDALSERLPEIDPDLIAQALADARAEGRASGDGDSFRLIPNH